MKKKGTVYVNVGKAENGTIYNGICTSLCHIIHAHIQLLKTRGRAGGERGWGGGGGGVEEQRAWLGGGRRGWREGGGVK